MARPLWMLAVSLALAVFLLAFKMERGARDANASVPTPSKLCDSIGDVIVGQDVGIRAACRWAAGEFIVPNVVKEPGRANGAFAYGPSGSGKTLLFSTIRDLLAPVGTKIHSITYKPETWAADLDAISSSLSREQCGAAHMVAIDHFDTVLGLPAADREKTVVLLKDLMERHYCDAFIVIAEQKFADHLDILEGLAAEYPSCQITAPEMQSRFLAEMSLELKALLPTPEGLLNRFRVVPLRMHIAEERRAIAMRRLARFYPTLAFPGQHTIVSLANHIEQCTVMTGGGIKLDMMSQDVVAILGENPHSTLSCSDVSGTSDAERRARSLSSHFEAARESRECTLCAVDRDYRVREAQDLHTKYLFGALLLASTVMFAGITVALCVPIGDATDGVWARIVERKRLAVMIVVVILCIGVVCIEVKISWEKQLGSSDSLRRTIGLINEDILKCRCESATSAITTRPTCVSLVNTRQLHLDIVEAIEAKTLQEFVLNNCKRMLSDVRGFCWRDLLRPSSSLAVLGRVLSSVVQSFPLASTAVSSAIQSLLMLKVMLVGCLWGRRRNRDKRGSKKRKRSTKSRKSTPMTGKPAADMTETGSVNSVTVDSRAEELSAPASAAISGAWTGGDMSSGVAVGAAENGGNGAGQEKIGMPVCGYKPDQQQAEAAEAKVVVDGAEREKVEWCAGDNTGDGMVDTAEKEKDVPGNLGDLEEDVPEPTVSVDEERFKQGVKQSEMPSEVEGICGENDACHESGAAQQDDDQ